MTIWSWMLQRSLRKWKKKEYRKRYYEMRKKFISIIRKYLNLENFASLQRKYKKLFPFVLMFEKFCLNKKKQRNIWFSGFASCLLKCKKSFKLEDRKFHFSKYKLLRVGCFYFLSSEGYLLKCFIVKARKFHFRKNRKNFFK